ncbi:MMPL family transporter [Alkalihalobacterium elongatum]|uniref:MMPL family transporter n=1 Tax=Alkalihalobacterium elongatum TaxID=2675466 RepID=UPI001C1FC6B7|nr:MMPL family transporter [Alkalihalobacterium elongatum]
MSKLAKYTSDRKWVWLILGIWIVVAGALSAAPSANDYTVNTGEDDLPKEALSVVASEKVKSYFSQEGLLALLVFQADEVWNESNISQIDKVSQWLTDETELVTIESTVPFHHFPDHAKEMFLSEDGSTIVLPVTLTDHLEMSDINHTVIEIQAYGDEQLDLGTLMVTGPAGIASDTIAIFSNADLVLLFSTIGLVLILLIVIYRSPLLAIIPLFAVAIVYQVVDRVLGLFAANQVFMIESQSLSIVMILLFGATTDYCLFVFSRYREELRKHESKHKAMKEAVKEVASPIFFSGGTVFAAMLVLFLANYGPYQNFAPVFAITIAIVLLAGLTLIPALFTIVGRRSFWPAIPKVGEETLKKNKFWNKVGSVVTKSPFISGGIVLLFLIVNGLNVLNVQYSFNLVKSFPDDMNSRIGFEQLEQSFPAGELAPVTILVEKEDGFTFSEKELTALERLNESLLAEEGVMSTSLPERDLITNGETHGTRWLSESGQAVKFDIILNMNPYDQEALDLLNSLNSKRERLLDDSGLGSHQTYLYFAGETAKQADIRELNERDTRIVIIVVTIVIFTMLIFHTRSLIAPIYMMTTILISYLSALGLSWFIFENLFGYEAMSYRIPLYAFVFLVALGVDYNIMLISRIREENRTFTIRESVQRGVAYTGGVISSAGLILAATFGVLMTQPILELFMFGFIVCIGILMDAFLVRGMLVPAIVTLLGRWNWWPSSYNKSK